MIRCENISYSYGKRKVLDGISLELRRGELVGIIGENGSGKTTLLRLISRMEEGEGGKITLSDNDYGEYGAKEFARHVSFFPQGRPTPDMDAKTLVSYGRYPHTHILRESSEKKDKETLAALKKVNAEEFSDRALSSLSYGERQRVYLALSVMQDADFILLDEPTNFLDIKNKFSTMEVLKEMAKDDKGVIAVLHDITLALTFCDRIIVISGGKIEADGSADQIVQSGVIERIFGVRCFTLQNDKKTEYIISQNK